MTHQHLVNRAKGDTSADVWAKEPCKMSHKHTRLSGVDNALATHNSLSTFLLQAQSSISFKLRAGMCFYYGCLKWPSHLPAHSPLDANELWAVIQIIPLPSKWRQRVRSYESLTFVFTPKLTQPVNCTVAWQAAEDDDGFSSDLKSFLEFPRHGWSFHLYAQTRVSQTWCYYTHVRWMLSMKDLFVCSKGSKTL